MAVTSRRQLINEAGCVETCIQYGFFPCKSVDIYDFGNGTTLQVVLIDVYALMPEYWKSQQLNLVVDGKEHLRALLCDDVSEVYQATWSRNPYLSNMLHMGCSNQQIVYSIKQIPERVDYRGKAEHLLQH